MAIAFPGASSEYRAARDRLLQQEREIRRSFEPPDPGPDQRHADPIGALWSLFDLLPEGRGSDRHPAFSYS